MKNKTPYQILEDAPNRLRSLANWYDRVYPKLYAIDNKKRSFWDRVFGAVKLQLLPNSGNEVQTSLRNWADAIEALLKEKNEQTNQ